MDLALRKLLSFGDRGTDKPFTDWGMGLQRSAESPHQLREEMSNSICGKSGARGQSGEALPNRGCWTWVLKD